jgi:hypothetical protein
MTSMTKTTAQSYIRRLMMAFDRAMCYENKHLEPRWQNSVLTHQSHARASATHAQSRWSWRK